MSRRLRGALSLPGDKSILHRALILAAMAQGDSVLEGRLEGEDLRSTWRCLQGLGVGISSDAKRIAVKGRGWRGLKSPLRILDAGNSGTTLRLLMGVIAGNPMKATLTGDSSLCRRPMGRVAEPLRRMGAAIELSHGEVAPVRVAGCALKGISFTSPIPSAQVKSAVLLAGLLASGETTVTEPAPSRDHTERMLPLFGIHPKREGLRVSVPGGLRLGRARLRVPGDVSSAAFWAVAATLAPGSELRLLGAGANPFRTGFLDVLERMGARIERIPVRDEGYGMEPVADLLVRSSSLHAAQVAADEVPGLIDEVPVLALAASQAEGVSRFRGLSELRLKESDRLEAVAGLLRSLGGEAQVLGDDLVVKGPRRLQGGRVLTQGDHRIALTALVAGLLSPGVELDDADCVRVSYPSFYDDLKRLC